MKRSGYIIYFLLLTSFCLCQKTFEIINGDTCNRIDNDGKKQGKWIILGEQKPGTCYSKEKIVEEGNYFNNRKNGLWSEYYCNGNIRNKLNFVGGRPNGEATTYYENGVISETGFWKNNRWVGDYKQYNDSGNLVKEIVFDSLGKRPGTSMIIYDNGSEPNHYNFNDNFDGKLHHTNQTPQDPSNKQATSFPTEKSKNQNLLNGKQTLYNRHKQITKEGIFKDNRLMDGKAYLYDENGVLTRIAVYKQGVYVGDASIE